MRQKAQWVGLVPHNTYAIKRHVKVRGDINRQIGQIDKSTKFDKSTNRQIDKSTNRQIDKSTNRQIDKSTNRQIDKSTNRQIDKSTNLLMTGTLCTGVGG